MGNKFSIEPADNFETLCVDDNCKHTYKLKFKLGCFDGSCNLDTLRITVMAKGGKELKNFLKFDSKSRINGKPFPNVITNVVNNGKTLRIHFDNIGVQYSDSLNVSLHFNVCDLPCKTPIKIKIDTDPTDLESNILIIRDLPDHCAVQNECCKCNVNCCTNKY